MFQLDDLYYRLTVTAPGMRHDLSDMLSTLLVEEDEGVPSALDATFTDEDKTLTDALHEGIEVEVDLGTISEHSVVFRGRVYQVDADFPHRDVSRVEVRAYDASMRMGLRRRGLARRGTLSGVVEEVAAPYAFDDIVVDLVDDPAFERNGVRQQDETDLAFLRRLAEDHGCVCFVTADNAGDRFHFQARARLAERSPDATLRHGVGGVGRRLLRFEARSDVADVDLRRTMSAIDYDTGKPSIETTRELEPAGGLGGLGAPASPSLRAPLTAAPGNGEVGSARVEQLEDLLTAMPSASAALRAELGRAVPRSVPTFLGKAALKARAANTYTSSGQGMRASGATVGDKDLRAQRRIEIDGVGDHFSGAWYLTGVRHRLDARGYRTDFECSR